MNAVASICLEPGCNVQSDGKCKLEHDPVESCPNYDAETHDPIEIEAVEDEQRPASPPVPIWSSDKLDPDGLSVLSRRRRLRTIALVGEEKVGKTTLLTSIFEAYCKGPFAGLTFAGSETMLAFAKLHSFALLSSGRSSPTVPRTSRRDGLKFFHLALARSGGETVDLAIADRSGETYADARTSTDLIPTLTEFAMADRVCFLLDGARLSSKDERTAYTRNFRQMINALNDNGALTHALEIEILSTKLDVSRQGDAADVGYGEEYRARIVSDWRSVREIDDDVLVLLKGRKVDGLAEAKPFAANRRTEALARDMRRINTMLREAKIEIAGITDNLSLDADGHIVVPFRRSLRRIFNNSNWRHGGRLFGGFWLSLRREERQRITLEGEPIREVDYRQLYPRLAYARAQHPQPDEDLYDIVGDGTGRDGWKKLFNAMLFSKGPLKNWPTDTLQHFPKGTSLRDACSMLCDRHSPIAGLFGKELGYSLMRTESDLLIRVMIDLAAMGHVSLPLHDAVLVAESSVDAAAQVMREAFEAGTGTPFRAIVSAK